MNNPIIDSLRCALSVIICLLVFVPHYNFAQSIANDLCKNATALPVTATPDFQLYTTTNSTPSGIYQPNCYPFTASYKDVWFTAIVPISGRITIETRPTNGGLSNTVLQAFARGCNNLKQIACDDDDGVGQHAKIELMHRTAGEQIWIRVGDFGNDETGDFLVAAYDGNTNNCVCSGTGEADETAPRVVGFNTSRTWTDYAETLNGQSTFIELRGNELVYTCTDNIYPRLHFSPQDVIFTENCPSNPIEIFVETDFGGQLTDCRETEVRWRVRDECGNEASYILPIRGEEAKDISSEALCKNDNIALDIVCNARSEKYRSFTFAANSFSNTLPSCGNTSSSDPIKWFNFDVTTTEGIQIKTQPAAGSNPNKLVIQVFKGDCENLEEIDCSSGASTDLEITGHSLGETIYIKVFDTEQARQEFQIGVFSKFNSTSNLRCSIFTGFCDEADLSLDYHIGDTIIVPCQGTISDQSLQACFFDPDEENEGTMGVNYKFRRTRRSLTSNINCYRERWDWNEGIFLYVEFADCPAIISVNSNNILSDTYFAEQDIFSSGQLSNIATVRFVAGNSINLQAGFSTGTAQNFTAIVEPVSDCSGAVTARSVMEETNSDQLNEMQNQFPNYLKLSPNPTNGIVNIAYKIAADSKQNTIDIFHANGKIINTTIIDSSAGNEQNATLSLQNVDSGLYFVRLQTSNQILVKKLLVIK